MARLKWFWRPEKSGEQFLYRLTWLERTEISAESFDTMSLFGDSQVKDCVLHQRVSIDPNR
jgi:hypothetical protein